MGCVNGKKAKISKADLNFLLENTQFTKYQIKVWYSGFVQDCPSGITSKFIFTSICVYFLI